MQVSHEGHLNHSEIKPMAGELLRTGQTLAEDPAGCDLAELNTCDVTAAAAADLLARVRQLHRQRPQAGIVVTGCWSTPAPAEASVGPSPTTRRARYRHGRSARIEAASRSRTPSAWSARSGWRLAHRGGRIRRLSRSPRRARCWTRTSMVESPKPVRLCHTRAQEQARNGTDPRIGPAV